MLLPDLATTRGLYREPGYHDIIIIIIIIIILGDVQRPWIDRIKKKTVNASIFLDAIFLTLRKVTTTFPEA